MSLFDKLFRVNKPKTVLLSNGIKQIHIPKGYEANGAKFRLVNEYKDNQPIRSTAFYKDNSPFIDYKKDDYISIHLDNMTIVEDKKNTRGPSNYRLIHPNESEITMSVDVEEINAEQLSSNSSLFPLIYTFCCEADGKQLSLDLSKNLVIAYFSNKIWGYESRYNCPLNERNIFFQRNLDRNLYHVTIDGVKFELLYEPEAALELITLN